MTSFLKFISTVALLLAAHFLHAQGEAYTMDLKVYKHQFSGLAVIRKTDSAACRVLLTSLTGPTLLDMQISPSGYKLIFCAKKLRRKAILKALQTDFALLSGIYQSTKKKKAIYHAADGLLSKAELHNRRNKLLLEIDYRYEDKALQDILLTHHNFNMTIHLQKIPDNASE